jgi:exonuclease-1
MVFDGALLPMKKRISDERKKLRMENRGMAEELLAKGEESQANRKFNEAVEIDSMMVYRLIQVLKQMNVQFVVAPYEADSQLTHMFNEGLIDFVITEDSDLLVFGATKVFFKMDPHG